MSSFGMTARGEGRRLLYNRKWAFADWRLSHGVSFKLHMNRYGLTDFE
jgi:hypothetical protein